MRAKLRAWDQADFFDVRHVIWNTWMATYGSFVPEEDLRSFFEDHYSVEALEKQFENPDTVCYVAEVDGHVVAYERTFFNKEEKRQYVASLYVLPENQGSGLGKELMRMAAQEARRRGLDNVWLGVMVQNQQAVDWYKKMGYQIVEEAPFTMGNTTVPHFVGYVPVQKIETSAEKISKQRER
ncbi:MAG: GNAT family N-acetyltransferase [Ignavibacteriales bacterium]|nr:GNAT family N-acetyltransferase [Ignavibacteriales bacterium]